MENDHISMIFYKSQGVDLATKTTSLTLAKSIIAEIFGDDSFLEQLPLEITDGKDRWIVTGSRSYEDKSQPDGYLDRGPIVIEILKSNCQVVKLVQMASF